MMAKMADRRVLVAGNWKMHKDHLESLHFVRDLGLRLQPEDTATVEVSVHPPFTDLRSVQTLIDAERLPMALGAQHCHHLAQGAFTGEISPKFLARLSVSYVIAGHSERRHLFGQADEEVGAIARAVVDNAMTPIICVGETEAQRADDQTDAVLTRQLAAALKPLTPAMVAQVVVAYEPVWAIGTGNTATAADAQGACALVRSEINRLKDPEAAAAVRILYGGSVKPDNAGELMAQPDIDGVLVGGASLDAADFMAIVRAARR